MAAGVPGWRRIDADNLETPDGLWHVQRMGNRAHPYNGKWLLSNVVTGQAQECGSLAEALEWVQELRERA